MESTNDDRKCGTCMSNLTSVLESINSRPKALLHAMGVNTNTRNQDSNNTSLYWQVENDGVRLTIPQHPRHDTVERVKDNEKASFGGMPRSVKEEEEDEMAASKDSKQEHVPISQESSLPPPSSFQVFDTIRNHLPTIKSQTVATSPIVPPTKPNEEENSLSLKIKCMKCGVDGAEGKARAFVKGPNPLSIVLCSNRLHGIEDIEEVLVHELIHVYDVHSRKWNLFDCETLAKSEVRAARDAECANTSLNFTKRFCVRDKARLATTNMFPDKGRDCVGKVFEEALKDYAPFTSDGGFTDTSRRQRHDTIRGRVFKSSYKNH